MPFNVRQASKNVRELLGLAEANTARVNSLKYDSDRIITLKTQDVIDYESSNGLIDWDGGTDYVETLSAGANPTAAIYPNGDVYGTTDNGEFIKFANGQAQATNGNVAVVTSPITFTGTITKIDADKLWIGRWK